MPHKEFARKYNRRVKIFTTGHDRIFSISYAPKDAAGFREQGSFHLSADTSFDMLMFYARHFAGRRPEDVADDLLLLQADCRIFEQIIL